MDELQDYKNTGFSPDQIMEMYESLTVVNDLLTRLICGDKEIIQVAILDALYWMEGFASYSKEGLH